jgi:hypothetical protein
MGMIIELTFTDFMIEDDPNCAHDYVQVLDIDNSELAKACGDRAPSPVRSSGNKMTVAFYSDDSVNLRGFSAEWIAVKADKPVERSGVITSPNYPNQYPENLFGPNSHYKISVDAGHRIRLEFTDLDIEGPYPTCDYDVLSIYEAEPTGKRRGIAVSIILKDEHINDLAFTETLWIGCRRGASLIIHKHREHYDAILHL